MIVLCVVWNRDVENIKYVEDWNRFLDRKEVIKMFVSFKVFEGVLLVGM